MHVFLHGLFKSINTITCYCYGSLVEVLIRSYFFHYNDDVINSCQFALVCFLVLFAIWGGVGCGNGTKFVSASLDNEGQNTPPIFEGSSADFYRISCPDYLSVLGLCIFLYLSQGVTGWCLCVLLIVISGEGHYSPFLIFLNVQFGPRCCQREYLGM